MRKSPRLQPIKEDEEDFSIHIVDPEGGENADKGPAEKAQRKVRATKNEGVNKRKAVEEVNSYTITVLVHCSSHFTTVDI